MVLDIERKFRIPLGQKQFKLVCPVVASDKDMLMIQWTKNGEQVIIRWRTCMSCWRD
ncbi:unnamed protein product [Heligmosomoides polygyrus]|uniref:Ig-like domain-containing protein n=1 Tax=Heligmosomoides polygyrus TaxID=6339 RepID=A0A183G7G4_HELPZ|nr:unnamed protein product [Heligmosomoides polygyrus]